MKKENIIEFVMRRDECNKPRVARNSSMSEELQKAIQNLIYRMRELGPIPLKYGKDR